MSPSRLSFQSLAVLLAALLISPGCTSIFPLPAVALRDKLSAPSPGKIFLQDQEGRSVRLDPNSEVRFFLRDGEVTPWISGWGLWVSKVGLSFEEDNGLYMIQWPEIAYAEVRNLSGAKTFGAILLTAVVIGTLVILIAAKGGGSPGGGGIGGGGSESSSANATHHWRRRSMGQATGIHLHLPLIIAAPHLAPEIDAGPPPPPHASGGEEIKQAFDQLDAEPAQATSAPQAVKAERLFASGVRRRSIIQFMAQADIGGDLVQLEGPTTSVLAGMRLLDVLDLSGGFRELITPVPAEERSLSCFIGVGRLGLHLPLDTEELFAIPFAVDIGAGQNVFFHFKLNVGLRVQLPYGLSLGLLPFNPTFTAFKQDTSMEGAKRWTFPTTLEVGFRY